MKSITLKPKHYEHTFCASDGSLEVEVKAEFQPTLEGFTALAAYLHKRAQDVEGMISR